MGLGKTIQTVTVLAHIKKQEMTSSGGNSSSLAAIGVAADLVANSAPSGTGKMLVIAPLSVLDAWKQEMLHAPSLTAIVYSGEKDVRALLQQELLDSSLCADCS